jgi:hypothetical protein
MFATTSQNHGVCDGFPASDSLCRRSTRQLWRDRIFSLTNPAPIKPFEQRGELRGRQSHYPVLDLRPAKVAVLQKFVPQAELQPLPPQMSSLWVSRTRFTHYSSGSCAAWESDTIAMARGFCCKRTAAGFGRFLCDGPILRALILKS